MSDADNSLSVEEQLAADLESIGDDSEKSEAVNSDTETDDTTVDSDSVENEVADSDTESDDSESESEEVDFNFRDTQTSIQKLVTKLSHLSPEDRAVKIAKLSRQKEIDAVTEAFPDAFEKPEAIGSKELAALREEVELLKKATNPDSLAEMQKLIEQGQVLKPKLEETVRNAMLKDKFGDHYKEIVKDPKFIESYDKFNTLDMEERLEIACTLSPVARKRTVDDEVRKEVNAKAAHTPSQGKPAETAKVDVSAEDLLTPEGMERQFGKALAALSD